MAYDVGVRNYLVGKGVASSDIDYDKNSGNVTIRKQPFYKPELNMSGSTYSNQTNLDNAFKTYSAQRPVIQPDGSTGTTPQAGLTRVEAPQTGMSSISTNVPNNANTGYKNPYVSQYEDIMKRLDESNKAMQQPVDIYSSPEYAAAKANQDKAAQQSTRQAQESMGASGFGRSTNLQDRAQGIQNEANNYLQTQLVPQIQSALQNKNQQQYNNLLSQFNTIYSMVNQADNQHQNEVSNANADRTFNQNQGVIDYNQDPNNPVNIGQGLQNEGAKLTNSLSKLQLAEYPEQSRKAAVLVQQQIDNGKIDQETAKFKLNELKDPNSLTNKAAKLDLQVKEIAAKYAEPEAKLRIKQLEKTISQIGAAPYQSDLDKKLDQVRYDTAVEQLNQLKNPKKEGNSKELNAELDGLYTGISTGQITASAAIDEINNKVKAGLTTPADAAQMLALINSVNSTVPNVKPKLNQNQIDANGGNNPQDLNRAQLDKLWNTDPTGKAAGRPSIDWAMWYTDPRGKVGGISYDAWKQAYGPQLKAR